MKYYYQHNERAVLVRKSTEPFAGSNCYSDLDMNLELYRVIVTQLRGDGWILGWKLEEPGKQEIAPVVRTLEERMGEMERMCLDLDYRQLLFEQGISDGEGGVSGDL